MSCSTSSVYIIIRLSNWCQNRFTAEIDSTQQLSSESKEEEIEVNLPSSHPKVEAAKEKLPSSIQKDEEASTNK